MLKKSVVLFLCVILLLFVSGCVATFGRNNFSETKSLKNENSDLKNELRAKDEEINSLKDSLNSRGSLYHNPVEETKSRPNAKQIQTALKNAGYYQGTIDGKIGKQTRQAIKKFQKENNLNADGKAGKATWSLLSKHL